MDECLQNNHQHHQTLDMFGQSAHNPPYTCSYQFQIFMIGRGRLKLTSQEGWGTVHVKPVRKSQKKLEKGVFDSRDYEIDD